MRKLRAGQLCFQFLADTDFVPLGEGASSSAHADLWTADPWRLMDALRPGMTREGHRVEGLSWGGRLLWQVRGGRGRGSGGHCRRSQPVTCHAATATWATLLPPTVTCRSCQLGHAAAVLSLLPLVSSQLGASVTALVGVGALSRLHLVLHLCEEQVEQVVQELLDHQCFG